MLRYQSLVLVLVMVLVLLGLGVQLVLASSERLPEVQGVESDLRSQGSPNAPLAGGFDTLAVQDSGGIDTHRSYAVGGKLSKLRA
jgi:hypothetical protein